jgi:hypothetical protein
LYEIPNEETDESALIHNNYNKQNSNTGGDTNTEGNTSVEMEWQILKKERKFSAPYK